MAEAMSGELSASRNGDEFEGSEPCGSSGDEGYERMTAAEVMEKLEEVSVPK